VLLEPQVPRERRVILDLLERMDKLEDRERLVYKVLLVCLDLSAWLHPRENVETLDLEENLVALVFLVTVEVLGHRDLKVFQDKLDPKEDQDPKVTLVFQVNVDQLDPLDQQEREDQEDQKENKESKEELDHEENRVPLENVDHLVPLVALEMLDLKV